MFFVYILKSQKDNSLYVGQTNNLLNRLGRHNSGQVKSTKAKLPYELCYFQEYNTRSEAMWREWELKKNYRVNDKLQLIKSFDATKIHRILTTLPVRPTARREGSNSL